MIPPNSLPAKKKPFTPISSASSPYDGTPYPINPATTLNATTNHAIIIAFLAFRIVITGKFIKDIRKYKYRNNNDKNLDNSNIGVTKSLSIMAK